MANEKIIGIDLGTSNSEASVMVTRSSCSNRSQQDEIRTVVEIQLGGVQKMLEKSDIRLTATKKAIRFIATLGFDPQFGARPIKRVIQKNLLNELSKMILEGKVQKDKEIVVDEKGGKLVFGNA